jgi:hypothetical protein
MRETYERKREDASGEKAQRFKVQGEVRNARSVKPKA